MVWNVRLAIIILVLALTFAGCSNSSQSPPLPDSNTTQSSSEPSKVNFGAYNLILDPSIPDVWIEPMRAGEGHFDILKYLQPPFCDNCFITDIVAYDPYANAFTIKVGLRNYSFFLVYDPRGIICESTGYKIVNPSGYYKLPPPGVGIAPRYGYIDFDSGKANRKFPPGSFREYTFQIAVPFYEKLYHVPFLIEASYPDNCREVYDMEHAGNTGNLTWAGGNLTVKYTVKDWQDDVAWVKIDASKIDGGWVAMTNTGGDTWQCVLHNSLHKPQGTYRLEAAAYSANGEGRVIYDYFDVFVN